jgi:Plasma-membrane choline transporter
LKHPVDRSMARTISYHLGTAVFGATLVAVLHFARAVWQEIYRWLKPTAVEQRLPEGAPSVVANQATSTSIVNCLMYPFTQFIAFVNRNAYIEVG